MNKRKKNLWSPALQQRPWMPPIEWPDSDTQWRIGATAAGFYTSELHRSQLTPDFYELLNCPQQDELVSVCY